MKTVNRYEVRYFPAHSGVSQRVGLKCRVLEYRRALAVVRRLKKAGVDAIIGSPWKIRITA